MNMDIDGGGGDAGTATAASGAMPMRALHVPSHGAAHAADGVPTITMAPVGGVELKC